MRVPSSSPRARRAAALVLAGAAALVAPVAVGACPAAAVNARQAPPGSGQAPEATATPTTTPLDPRPLAPVEQEPDPSPPLWVGAVVGGAGAVGVALAMVRRPRRSPG